MFYAQRNVYLTGSCIFLALVLFRFYSLVLELIINEEKTEVLKQQATKASKEYMKLLDGEQGKMEELSRLKKELDESLKKSNDFDILKKQADRTAAEYMALTDRYVELENKMSKNSGKDQKKDI